MSDQVLVLNRNYEPLNVCSWQRAVTLVCMGKAIPLAHNARVIHSPSTSLPLPTVVRLADQVKRPLPKIKLSRSSVMARDSYSCQYCGDRSKPLTVDHVVPRERGGKHIWENVVACCGRCNGMKGNRTPAEAGMELRNTPQKPRFMPYLSLPTFLWALRDEVWRDYLEPFAPHLVARAAEVRTH